jgi:lipopolysaccharide/colanic/teichoic acid biosynthesis glycosyltransferase
VARLAKVAEELQTILGLPPERILSAYDYRSSPMPTGMAKAEGLAADSPGHYETSRFTEALSRLRTPMAGNPSPAGTASGTAHPASTASPVLAILGPLSALPEVRQACDLQIFIHVDEGLAMLRWADDLLQAGAPGGIEALELYSRLVAPAYQRWSAAALQAADLVLDDEEGPVALAEKTAYLFSQRWAAGGKAPSKPGSAVDDHATESRTTAGNIELQPTVKAGPAANQGRRLLSAADRRSRLKAARALELRLRRSSLPARLQASLRRAEADLFYPAAKRALDILVVSLVLLVAWPILALVALLVWSNDPGPVIYVQTRVGRYGRVFAFPKFRSMVQDADKLKDKLLALNEMQGGITFKMKRDPRVLPIGRVMRKYSLDELPQLWSVLRGDLTLVGPRPPVPREVALYTSMDRRRLEAVPGLTCIWQVSGRSDIPFPRQVELDVEYLEQRSLSLDLRLLLATVPAVITGKGAY